MHAHQQARTKRAHYLAGLNEAHAVPIPRQHDMVRLVAVPVRQDEGVGDGVALPHDKGARREPTEALHAVLIGCRGKKPLCAQRRLIYDIAVKAQGSASRLGLEDTACVRGVVEWVVQRVKAGDGYETGGHSGCEHGWRW